MDELVDAAVDGEGGEPPMHLLTSTWSTPTSTITCTLPYFRTTHCDIQCTVNTFVEWQETKALKAISEKASKLVASATLPKRKTKAITSIEQGVTPFQKLKLAEAHIKHNQELLSERNEYFKKLKQEKRKLFQYRNECAVKIQALFRGFRLRRKRAKTTTFVMRSRQKPTKRLNVVELRSELCYLAAILSLPPIAGLSLEKNGKSAKRKNKIENAAAYRIQLFFSMIICRRKAREYMIDYREGRRDKAARIVTRFIRFIRVLKFSKKAEQERRNILARTIQRWFRGYITRMKWRTLIKKKLFAQRMNEAGTVIGRSMKKKQKKLFDDVAANKKRNLELTDEKASESVDLFIINYLEADVMNLLTDLAIQYQHAKEADRMRIETLTDELGTNAIEAMFTEFCDVLFNALTEASIDEEIRRVQQASEELIKEALRIQREAEELAKEIKRRQEEEAERTRLALLSETIAAEARAKAEKQAVEKLIGDSISAAVDKLLSDVVISSERSSFNQSYGVLLVEEPKGPAFLTRDNSVSEMFVEQPESATKEGFSNNRQAVEDGEGPQPSANTSLIELPSELADESLAAKSRIGDDEHSQSYDLTNVAQEFVRGSLNESIKRANYVTGNEDNHLQMEKLGAMQKIADSEATVSLLESKQAGYVTDNEDNHLQIEQLGTMQKIADSEPILSLLEIKQVDSSGSQIAEQATSKPATVIE